MPFNSPFTIRHSELIKICFIINPKSGTGDWKGIEEKITNYLAPCFSPTILRTEHPGHATELAREAAKTNEVIVAVGGDGMMNETAKGVLNSSVTLGIIPTGSGNALARHLGIPLNQHKAIECLNKLHSELIDTSSINGEPFFAVAGTGFDAEIAAKFASSSTRGFWTYTYLSFTSFFKYKPVDYDITIDGEKMRKKAFLISIANSSQYGNNAYIAPNASLQNGSLEVCILKQFPWIAGLILGFRLFTKTINHSPFMETISGKNIEIKRADGKSLCIHYDGETALPANNIKVEVKPKALKVIFPEGRKI
jgi:diacylglycerol kinase (ATP)